MNKKGVLLAVSVVALLVAATQLPKLMRNDTEESAQACESFIKGRLRSPSTYQRAELTVSPEPDADRTRSIFIKYDAANAFGTPIRGMQWCKFKVEADGKFPSLPELQVSLVESELSLRDAMKMAGQKVDDLPFGEPLCCISRSVREK